MSSFYNMKNRYQPINHNTWGWKLYLVYDVLMLLLILVNIFCLSVNATLMSDFGYWLFHIIQLPHVLIAYKSMLHPWVVQTESWFTIFLISEFIVRWLIAMVFQHHKRWFFFPFVHWYEVLAIIPQLRFLRLFRAGVVAYRLDELGYEVIPKAWIQRAFFYYHVLMEELSSQIVVTVLDGIKRELSTSTTHKQLIHELVDHHRQVFAETLAQVLQESLAAGLKEHQLHISQHVGKVVNQAIEDTPEITQLLRLLPIVGSRIEQQMQSIGQRLGENISYGLLEPVVSGNTTQPNEMLQIIALKTSQMNIENKKLEALVESVVFESIESIQKQVKVKQWEQFLEKKEAKTE